MRRSLHLLRLTLHMQLTTLPRTQLTLSRPPRLQEPPSQCASFE